MSLDFNLVSLYRVKGQEAPFLPGVLAQTAPRHAARGRENDRLLIYLHLGGNVPFSAAEYAQVTAKLAERFYSTAGSLTFALKSSVEALNSVLAERNMRSTGQGKYIVGALILAALRGDLLYLVQSGPTRALWLGTGGQKTFHDAALAGKGLGLSQTARMYFAQTPLAAGERLLLCMTFPPEWESALSEERGPASLESTRRRLTIVSQANLNALLIQTVEGAGETHILRPAPQENHPPEAAVESVPPPAPEAAAASQTAARQESPAPEAANFTESLPARPRPVLAPEAIPHRVRRRAAPPLSAENQAALRQAGRSAARFSAQLMQSARQASHKVAAWLAKYSPRLLPDEQPDNSQPASSWAALAALIVPLLIVTMALVIYSEKGRPAQYQSYYNHAIEAAMQTIHTSDPAELRVRWKASLDWLDKAEAYQQTADSRRLREEAQTALDSLDRVQRVDFRVAFATPLNAGLRVTHMAASDIDLYLLNDSDGKVLRGALSGTLYNLQNFDCGPGVYDGISVGPLVDIIALPRTTPNGITLMGVDAAANLLYCIPGETPLAARLLPPNTGWKGVTDMAYDAGTLYLLDPQNNAIWFYYGQAGVNFADPPNFFFQQEVPNMKDSLGMVVNGDDLYVLHRDGHLTMCTLSRISSSPTHCSDPATLIDTRAGFANGSTLADGVFSQIQFTGAPDPALVMLEPFSRAIFHFAPRTLELQYQLRAQPGKADPLPADVPITATTLSPNKSLFLFINGQVYFADKLP